MPLYNNYAKLIKKRIITTIYNEIIRIQRECDKENVYKKIIGLHVKIGKCVNIC